MTQIVARKLWGNFIPRRYSIHVPGAPIQPGSRVSVVGPEAPAGIDAEMCAPYIGCQGVIEELHYSTGCGDGYPKDPMLLVLLDDGRRYHFWNNEVRRVPAKEYSA